MKFAVVIFALVAAVSAQFNSGLYNNGRYNQYDPFNPFNRNLNHYRPYSTPAPYRYRPLSVSPSVTIAPTPFSASTPAPTPLPGSVPVARILSDDSNAETLRSGNEIAPDGSFSYFYETSNGIAAQEQGAPRDFGGNPPVAPVVVQGSFSWTSPEGVPIAVSYIADENGYQPSIVRAFDYNGRSAIKK